MHRRTWRERTTGRGQTDESAPAASKWPETWCVLCGVCVLCKPGRCGDVPCGLADAKAKPNACHETTLKPGDAPGTRGHETDRLLRAVVGDKTADPRVPFLIKTGASVLVCHACYVQVYKNMQKFKTARAIDVDEEEGESKASPRLPTATTTATVAAPRRRARPP